jgi:hypothetical protein
MAGTAATARAAACACALTVAACGGGGGEGGVVPDSSLAARAAERVRRQYAARDVVAAGAFTWPRGGDTVFVLVDAQSSIEGLVQARADLWVVADTLVVDLGRSDVMPSAAEFGAWAFEDLTGDGLPEFFGYLADSAGVAYPVFIPGATGRLTEELTLAAPGFIFATLDSLPSVVRSGAGACALRLWAEAPAPDSAAAGWRYLPILPDGSLMRPMRQPPVCD